MEVEHTLQTTHECNNEIENTAIKIKIFSTCFNGVFDIHKLFIANSWKSCKEITEMFWLIDTTAIKMQVYPASLLLKLK